MKRLNSLIYGSCVSRDLARIDAGNFLTGYYVARQSWISAWSTPCPPLHLCSTLNFKDAWLRMTSARPPNRFC